VNPSFIEDAVPRKILDSRGKPTIEVDVYTRLGMGRAAAPSGASTGRHEVVAFPEGGVDQAINEVEENVAPELRGMDAMLQNEVDELLAGLDGTPNFSNIGGNTAVAISLATAKAASASFGLPLFQFLGGNFVSELPYPLGNVIGGGAHAQKATDIQEFLVVPVGARNISQALEANALAHKKVKENLKRRHDFNLGKGDEGAWAPDIADREALEILAQVSDEVEEETDVKVRLGLDVAASELYDEKSRAYIYPRENKKRSPEEQLGYMRDLIEEFSLFYVEDPFQEEDFKTHAQLTSEADCLVCGDDLYVTNSRRLEEGVEVGATNSILIKPNQCGTLSSTQETVRVAKRKGIVPVISHRSGETTDETIAHLAVGLEMPLIKTGAVGGERIAKLNELVRIEEELLGRAKMADLPEI